MFCASSDDQGTRESLLEDAVVACGAGSGDVVVGPHEAQIHCQQGTAHVGDSKGYTEGVHLLERLQHRCTD